MSCGAAWKGDLTLATYHINVFASKLLQGHYKARLYRSSNRNLMTVLITMNNASYCILNE